MSEGIQSASLKKQFASIQEQQQKKLALRKQKQEEQKKQKSASKGKEDVTKHSATFGVEDDLNLKLADPPAPSNSIYSEELVTHLNEQIREMKDETGRLYKLLSERDFELRQLRKKREDDKFLQGAVTNDTASTKIVELSKKIRQMSTELESEKTKSKQLQKKCMDLEKELEQASEGDKKSARGSGTARGDAEKLQDPLQDIKSLQDKLKHAEMKVSEFRNQATSLQKELKMAQKVIEQEVGEGATVQSLLGGTGSSGGWRGRSQQIIALQKKVNELKAAPPPSASARGDTDDLESEFMGSAVSRRTIDDKQKAEIRRMERERKEQQERLANELKALEVDHEALKGKLDSSKARNKVLSTEVKTSKQQIETLLEKGRHDDELVTALFKQISQLKQSMEEQDKSRREKDSEHEATLRRLSQRDQQDGNTVDQLKAIVAEREAKVHALEQQLEQERLAAAQNAGVGEMFRHSSRPTSSQAQSRPNSALVVEDFGTMTPHPQSRAESRADSARPGSSRQQQPTSVNSGVSQQEFDELTLQVQELKTVCQAASVERDRLNEFVKVLHRRIDEASTKAMEAQSELIAVRRRNVQLEKQLGKAKCDSVPASAASKRMMGSRISLSTNMDDEQSAAAFEEMETNYLIQKDENEALKAALQSTLYAKEADLKLYNDMMEETKSIFLQGLRQYRDSRTS